MPRRNPSPAKSPSFLAALAHMHAPVDARRGHLWGLAALITAGGTVEAARVNARAQVEVARIDAATSEYDAALGAAAGIGCRPPASSLACALADRRIGLNR